MSYMQSKKGGCICVFLTRWVMGLFAVIAIVYGVILVVSGVYKAKSWFDARKDKLPGSIISLISAVLSVILGTVVIVNPFTAANFLWIFAGLSLIVEAILDLAAVIVNTQPWKENESREDP